MDTLRYSVDDGEQSPDCPVDCRIQLKAHKYLFICLSLFQFWVNSGSEHITIRIADFVAGVDVSAVCAHHASRRKLLSVVSGPASFWNGHEIVHAAQLNSKTR